jgi:predicted GNAT superfamily acetyltransferase
MDYRPLYTIDELTQVVELEIAVWGLDPKDAAPVNMMRPITMHGGSVIGAYDGDFLAGMCLAFPTKHHNRWVLWSHMTGVHPDYQGQGIGFGLKQAQRVWALEYGYDEIRWTFDPLQRGNANFNLHQLGATAAVYHPDYYGQMTDAINRASVSDRIEASWKLRDRRVKALAQEKQTNRIAGDLSPDCFILKSRDDGSPLLSESYDTTSPTLFAQIPRHRSSLSSDALYAWRYGLRDALQAAFAKGYTATDFVEVDGTSAYVLRASPAWYMYVLLCSDDSLYTGIALDVRQRFVRHQTGRGAAYTAMRRPIQILAAWKFPDRSRALKAEAAFKALTRSAKLAHIERKLPYRDAPYVDPDIF